MLCTLALLLTTTWWLRLAQVTVSSPAYLRPQSMCRTWMVPWLLAARRWRERLAQATALTKGG